MKPWLERTLLAIAILLVSLAILWAGSSWWGMRRLEVLRERWESNGWAAEPEELLPPLVDGANDTGTKCLDALERMIVWQFGQKHLDELQGLKAVVDPSIRPRNWTVEQARQFALYDDREFQTALTEFLTTVDRPECRLFRVYEGSSCPYIPGGLTFQVSYMLEREAYRQFLIGNRSCALDVVVGAFATAAHLREVPTVECCEESDSCFVMAVDVLRFCAERGALDDSLAVRIRRWLLHVRPDVDWVRAVDGERTLLGEYVWGRLRDGNMPMGVGIPVDPLGLLYSKLARPWRILQEEKYFEVLEEKRALVAEHPWEKLRMPEIPSTFVLARMLTSSRDLDGEKRLRVRRARDLTEIALRLVVDHADTGSCPESLAALRDLPTEPPLGQPYSFSRTESGFTLGLSDPAQDPDGMHTWRVTWSPPR